MTKRKIVKPVVKLSDRLKKYILIATQTLFGVLFGVCFFIYNINAKFTVELHESNDVYTASFGELTGDYFDSYNYDLNLRAKIDGVLRFVAYRSMLEVRGEYDPMMVVDINDFCQKRFGYERIDCDAKYYLAELIAWSQSGVDHYYHIFNSKEEFYESFTAVDRDAEIEDLDKYIRTGFEMLQNKYVTVDGLNVEECVNTPADYNKLSRRIEETIQEIYNEYNQYLYYENMFAEDATNLHYYVTFTDETGTRHYYTNTFGLGMRPEDKKVMSFFKNYGEYIYISPNPAASDYLTNTPIEFSYIQTLATDILSYAYPVDTQIWIAIDKEFPIEDVFAKNHATFVKASNLVPWIVSLGAISVIAFLALGVMIVLNEKKLYSYPGAADDLKDFDKLPIEISFSFFLVLVLVLYIGETIFVRNMGSDADISMSVIPLSLMTAMDIYIALLFFYGFSRRIICGNLFKGSIFSMVAPHFSKFARRFGRRFWRVYDSAGVAVRTWSAYIMFLLVNLFFGSIIIFGNKGYIAGFILVVFDIAVGVILFNRSVERKKIVDGIRRINDGEYDYKIDDRRMHGDNKDFADAVNQIGAGIKNAVELNIKDEKMKADLITNVSHDIKTPLTSIINYVDLLKRENIENERAVKYIGILDEKSQRLKQLTFDLVEASKITSGNIILDIQKLDFNELINQAIGEFEERFEERGLTVVKNTQSGPAFVKADPARMWRVIENLLNNIAKYALEDTRVYVDLVTLRAGSERIVTLSLKNISGQQLNIPADELTERFIRGDVSRSTEGTGLGLSIAKSLTMAQGGDFEIYLDGDLFKVMLSFKEAID